MNITAKAYTAITLQSLITGFSFLALKIALRSADTMDLLAHRFTLAALSVLIFTLFRRSSLTIHLRDFLRILPYGIIYPIIFFLFQTLGMTQISSSEAGIIYAVVPIFTLIIAGLLLKEASVYKGYKRDKIEMRGDRAEMSDFPLYLNTVAGGLDCRDQTIGGFSFVVKIYAVPVVEIIG